MILESGYVTTALSTQANNCFGMKCTLSNNSWKSVWDGKSKINIKTAEQDASGNTYYIYADFRKYPCIEDSIKDHAAYLLGATNGDKLRYEGLTECTSYTSAAKLIKDGGYATDISYVQKIVNIVKRFGLDKYDSELVKSDETPVDTTQWYRVRKSWGKSMKGQIGAYKSLNEAKRNCSKGYNVYDYQGTLMYIGKDYSVYEKIQQAVTWAKKIAADNSHGYDNREGHRWGPDYACSSLIIQAYEQAGVKVRTAGATKTANMRSVFVKLGFEDVTRNVNLKTGNLLQAGDVLLTPGKHTEMYVGNGQLVGARGNANSGKAENGKQGDQTGQEIALANYYSYPWKYVLRFRGVFTDELPTVKPDRYSVGSAWDYYRGRAMDQHNSFKSLENARKDADAAMKKFNKTYYVFDVSGNRLYTAQYVAPPKSYVIYAGNFKLQINAKRISAKLTKAGISNFIKKKDSNYVVQAGSFSNKGNAESTLSKIKKLDIDAYIEEIY